MLFKDWHKNMVADLIICLWNAERILFIIACTVVG